MKAVGRWPKVGISLLIVGEAFLAGCGTTRPSASHSSTSLAPKTTSTIPYTGPKLTGIGAVFCADAMHCWAGAAAGTSGDESAILASTDGGATWSVQDLIPGVDGIGPIDCPSDTHCMAAGDRVVSQEPPVLLSTTDGGTTWSTQPMSGQVYELDAISCVNDSDCWLVEAQPLTEKDIVMATSNWGSSWTVQNESSIDVSMGVSYGISCPSTSDCVIVGVGALTTTNGGSTWQERSVPTGELNGVSCPSVGFCVAQGDVTSAVPANTSTDIATSDDGGMTWQVRLTTVSGGVGDLGSPSCPTTTLCLLVGSGYTYTSGGPPNGQVTYWGAVERTTDGGSTWTTVKLPQESGLDGLSCLFGSTECIATGLISAGSAGGTEPTAGVILRTLDGGSTWTSIPFELDGD